MDALSGIFSGIQKYIHRSAVHIDASVPAIDEFLFHLIILIQHLIFRCLTIFQKLLQVLNRCPAVFIVPVQIIAAKQIDCLEKIIVCIGLFPR